jgi:hypothetical protein
MKRAIICAVTLGLMASAIGVQASTDVAGITFDDNAFADTLMTSFGGFTTSGGSLATVLTDLDVGTYAFSLSQGAYVQLGFADNLVVNGASDDLAFFELGIPDTFRISLTIAGTTINYLSQVTGYSAAGYSINVAKANLDDFGLAAGATLDSIVIGMDLVAQGGTVPSLSLVGALNSQSPDGVPEGGSSLVLLGMGFLSLFIARRRCQ